VNEHSSCLDHGRAHRIGRAAAVAFAKKGAKVVIAGRREEAGKALVKELRSLGAEAEFINADVRQEDDTRAMVDKTVARFGRLDVAVNNAATEGQVGVITEQTAESYAATFDTNVLGVLLSMKHEVRVMQKQRSGNIINISSTYGHRARRGLRLCRQQARRRRHYQVGRARGSRLGNPCECRGARSRGHWHVDRFTATPENKAALVSTVPMARLGLPEEQGNAIVFIASDEAAFITDTFSTSTAV